MLLAASFPPVRLAPIPFVALAPFAVWVMRLPVDAAGARAAALGGMAFGATAYGLLLHWIVPALARVTPWAPVAWALAVGVLASLVAVFGWAFHRAIHRGVPVWLALPVTWTATEWAHAHLPGTLAFPWLGLGTSLTAHPEWVGIAEVAGARGVTFWLAAVSGLVAGAVAGASSGAAPTVARRWAVVSLAAFLPAAGGVVRARTLETVPVARVAIVQTDVPASARSGAARWNAAAAGSLDRLLADATPGEVDLLVLPEGWLMSEPDPRSAGGDGRSRATGPGPLVPDAFRETLRHPALRGLPILTGVYEGVATPPGPIASEGQPSVTNEVRLLTSGGWSGERYLKRRLVPLVETDGLGGGFAARPRPAVEGAPAPTGDALFRVDGVLYGPLICFEAAFADAARDARLRGAHVLVNVTNDGWFTETGWGGRMARAQHAAHLVMRAVEHRMGAVRSANGGYAFVVDPSGRVRGGVADDGARWIVEQVRTTPGPTLFTRFGDWPGWGAALGALLLAGLRPRGARGRRAAL